MTITITDKLKTAYREGLTRLYGSEDAYTLFERSFITLFAEEREELVGAVRIISEGVETALLVDLEAENEGKREAALTAQNEIKRALLSEAEKRLTGRRVMAYGSRRDLDLFEEMGFGRCKNAWTFYRESFDETEFLPAGFRYENEFLPAPPRPVTQEASHSGADAEKRAQAHITYRSSVSETTYEAINEVLTKAFWGHPHDVEKTTEAFKNSQFAVAAYDGGRLVGVARAVADTGREDERATEGKYATILNVAVDPGYQGLSIGKNLVLNLSGLIPAKTIVLNTHPGAVGFYNKIREYRRNLYVFEKHIHEGGQREMPPERRISMFTPKGFKFPQEYI
jgi:ribosomal protein S18 acetylase RimI-like enzyme